MGKNLPQDGEKSRGLKTNMTPNAIFKETSKLRWAIYLSQPNFEQTHLNASQPEAVVAVLEDV